MGTKMKWSDSSRKKMFSNININHIQFIHDYLSTQIPIQSSMILPAKALTEISIRNTPPNMGGVRQTISPEEFKNQFGIDWQEGVQGAAGASYQSAAKTNLTSGLSQAELTQQVSQLLETPETRMELCKINDTVGYGVFASSSIPKNRVLSIYSGTIRPLNNNETSNYTLRYYQSNLGIIPENFRGFASFFQHLPDEVLIKNGTPEENVACMQELLRFSGQNIGAEDIRQTNELLCMEYQDEQTLSQIATANLTLEYLVYEGVPLVVMVTKRAIMPGEQLGFNYGYNYWLSASQNPAYFTAYGQIISPLSYKRNYGSLNIDGFIYTGEFQELINALHDPSSAYITLNMNDAQKQVSKATLEVALYKSAALWKHELNYANFEARNAYVFTIEEHKAKVDEFLDILTQTSMEFNQKHCSQNDTTKGYWRFSELEQVNSPLPPEYKSGFLNSEFFVQEGDFCFRKKPKVSSWDACASLVKENSFGIITDNLWATICHLLALHKYLEKPVFDALFPQLTLSDSFNIDHLFSTTGKYHKSHGGLLKYTNTPDYKFRHPYSPYATLVCLNLPTGLLYFGGPLLLQQSEIEEWLEQKYYEEQTPAEQDYIQKVSANKLLEYPTQKSCFNTKKYDLRSSRGSLYALLHSTQNQYDLDILVTEALKDTAHLLELEFYSSSFDQEKVYISAFGSRFSWHFSFVEGEFSVDDSRICPLKEYDDLLFQPMWGGNRHEHTSSRYSYAKRKPLILSEETLTVCTSIISFFTNANHFDSYSNTDAKAFELIQKLRHQLLELKANNQLQQEEAPKPPVDVPQVKQTPDPTLATSETFINTMTLLHKKENCLKRQVRLSYELGLPKEPTIDEIEKQKKILLTFWHPDRNRSIIATSMCQNFAEKAEELIEVTEELPMIQEQLDAEENNGRATDSSMAI